MAEKKLGFGLMRLPLTDPEDGTRIDMSQMERMVDTFLDRGFTYFDTAWMYHNYASESAVRQALVERHPRDRFTVATKMHMAYFNNEEERENTFRGQLERVGVSYFDYYLLHALTEENYRDVFQKLDCFGWLAEKKQQGLVRQMGFSFHDRAEVLEQILTEHPEVDFVQLQINYLDWDSSDVQSRLCYETACRHGKSVVVMEPVKGGTLANLPPAAEAILRGIHPDWTPASWALRFAAGLPGVKMVLSGMSNWEQLEENTGFMADCPPLTEEEQEALYRVSAILRGNGTVPCTGCSYCVDGCPMSILIPQVLALYNEDRLQDPEGAGWTPPFTYYENLVRNGGGAGACIGCGHCVAVCPQHIAIPEWLQKAAARFGQ